MPDLWKPDSFKMLSDEAFPHPEEDEVDILKRFNDFYGEAKRAKEPIKRMMDNSYLSYRSIMSDFSYSRRDFLRWGFAVFVPLTFQAIASLEAQLNGRPPRFRISPQSNPTDFEEANFVNHMSHAEFRRSKAMIAVVEATQLALVFGTSFIQTVYRYDVKTKKFLKETKITEDKDGKPIKYEFTYEDKPKVFYQGVAHEVDHPLTVYLPKTRSTDPQKWPFYIVRDLVDSRDLKDFYQNHPELAFKENFKYLKGGGDLHDDLEIYDREDPLYKMPLNRYPGTRSDLVATVFAQRLDSEGDTKHLIERFRVKSQITDEWFTVAGGRIVEHHPNPLEDTKDLPVTVFRDYKIANSPWGVGEPELIRWLQYEANSLHTLALDSTKYSVSPIFGVNDALIDSGDIEIYPGKMIYMKNIPGLTIDQAIKTLNIPEVKGSIFKMMGLNEDIVAKTTGTGASVIGGGVDADGSATAFKGMQSATEARIYDKARRIESECLTDLIGHQVSFMAQFYDEEMTFKISDQVFYKFMPGQESDYTADQLLAPKEKGFKGVLFGSDLAKGYDVYIEGESTLPMSQSQKRMEGMQLLKLAAETRRPPTAEEVEAHPEITQLYPQGVPVANAEKVFREIVMPTFSTVENIDEFVWRYEQGAGADRKRSPGRPDSPYNEPIAPDADASAMLTQAQPENQNVNAVEEAPLM